MSGQLSGYALHTPLPGDSSPPACEEDRLTRLLAENDRLRAVIEGMAARIAAQSDQLSRRAEGAGG